jgi:class 3 adenylate cyclase
VFPPPQWLKGKIVMVGAVRPYEDRHPTPLAVAFGAARGMLPGVVLHTHVLAQLLEQRSARSLGAPLTWGLFALLSVLGALLAAVETRAWVSVSIAAGLVVALWAASFVSFLDGYPPLPLLGPSAVFVVTLLAVGTWLGRHERRQRRFLRRAFSRYVSPTVVEAVCAKPDSLALGGERRELSFVFTDVEGFTTLSESLEPEALGELFNQYLNGIVKLIFEYDGTLEKFVGDAVMTMFGAPLRQPDHACRALDFALAVDRWTREFEALQLSRGIAFGRTRVGVNSGVATVGNFGGTLQFSYTAHGDCVNTAARLETLNKHLRTRVCVGARTAELCSDRPLRPVGDVVLKGKSEGLRVYEYHVQDSRDHSPRVDYMAAFRRLEQGDHGAAPHFESLRRAFPDDPLLQYHCERLLDGQQGVRIVMETK